MPAIALDARLTIDELTGLLLSPGPPVAADDVARFARSLGLVAPRDLCALLERCNGGYLTCFVSHGDFTIKSVFGLRDDDEILSLRAWIESPTFDSDHLPIARCRRSLPVSASERCISVDRVGRIWCDSYFSSTSDSRNGKESVQLAHRFDRFVTELRPEENWELDRDLYQQGRAFVSRGEADEALRSFHDSWNLHPHPATAHQMAELLLGLGRLQEALDWSTRSHKTSDGRHGKYAMTHAQCLIRTGRRDEAIAVLEHGEEKRGHSGREKGTF